MRNNRFQGWYFKHQNQGETLAFIPGEAKSGAFVQMIDSRGSRHFEVPDLRVKSGIVYAGACVFSPNGISIRLPGVEGEVLYGPLAPLRSPIMGPFHYLPMECRHGVISMGHSLRGSIQVDGRVIRFDGGQGYIEKDSGISFPSAYVWLQCNAFSEPCSVMLSIANIPFGGLHFRGCICAILYKGREYRLATYGGVRILAVKEDYISLAQGKLTFEAYIKASSGAYSLRAPIRGGMGGMIRESNHTHARFILRERGITVFDLESENAGFEYAMSGLEGGPK